jgi:hypothetical protein
MLSLGLSGGRVALAMHRCHKPTIVALNGSAVGVGMTMTLPAAVRYIFYLSYLISHVLTSQESAMKRASTGSSSPDVA